MSDGAGQDTNQPTDPPAGSSVGFGPVEFEARLLLSAQLEPDADHDGYGDETQDQCPTDAATQGPCPLVTPPPADKTPPAFSASISKLLKLSKSGAISFTLTSGENATGTATGTVSLPRTSRVVRFKTAKFSLSAGKRTKVTLKLPKSALKKVRSALRHHRLKAKLTITAKDAAGNQTVKKLSAKLKH